MKICSVLSTVHISFYLLNIEFPFTMTATDLYDLDNYENEIIRLSLYSSYFSPKRATLSSRLLFYFTNVIITSKARNLDWGNEKMGCAGSPIKGQI